MRPDDINPEVWARAAEAFFGGHIADPEYVNTRFVPTIERIARATQEAVREEREACAQVCENMTWHKDISPDHVRANEPDDFATAIRQRGEG